MKTKPGRAKPEVFCSAYKSQEVWDGKGNLVVKPDIEYLEEKSIDPNKKSF